MIHDDAPDFADQDAASLIESSPEWILNQVDRAAVANDGKVGGLHKFVELAWHTVEGQGLYRSNWHIQAICEHLEAVSSGDVKRLVIAVPPRHMKSLSTAVMWLPWDWIKKPRRRFLFSSYALNLAIRDSVKCRRVLESPWYKSRWGESFKLTSDQNTKIKFENNEGGYRLSTSVGGQLTGEGGDIVVVDDPLNSRDADSEKKREGMLTWWRESMSTRLNDPANGAFVVIQQRLHSSDLIGDVVKQHGLI